MAIHQHYDKKEIEQNNVIQESTGGQCFSGCEKDS